MRVAIREEKRNACATEVGKRWTQARKSLHTRERGSSTGAVVRGRAVLTDIEPQTLTLFSARFPDAEGNNLGGGCAGANGGGVACNTRCSLQTFFAHAGLASIGVAGMEDKKLCASSLSQCLCPYLPSSSCLTPSHPPSVPLCLPASLPPSSPLSFPVCPRLPATGGRGQPCRTHKTLNPKT